MQRIVTEEIEQEKNQIKKVWLRNYELENKTINELFYAVLTERSNMELMFNEEIDLNEYKRYINYFIPDESKNYNDKLEVWDYIERMCNQNKTFFSAISEGFVALVIKRYLGADSTHALIDIRNTQIDTHTGIDGAFFSSKKSELFFVEAKFYTKGKAGAKSVASSLSNKAKNKYDSFRNSTDIYIAEILNKESYNVRTVDAMSLNLTFVGFVIHEDDVLMENRKFAQQIEAHVNELYDLDDLEYQFILFHLKVDGKKQLIFDIITKAKEVLNG